MKLLMRGVFWFGLYVFLVTFPLVVAAVVVPRGGSISFLVNLADGLGYLALAMMALELALVSRMDQASGAFGQDALLQFHRGMGLGALGLVLLHPLLLVSSRAYPIAVLGLGVAIPLPIRLGTFAALTALLLVATSLLRKRFKVSYEAWRLLHGIFAVLILLLVALHVSGVGRFQAALPMRLLGVGYLAIFLGVFLRYRLVRPLLLWRRPWEVVENRAELGGARTIRVRPVGHAGFAFQPGQFAWVNLGRTPFHLEQHPISMSSDGDVAPGGDIAFTIRALGDWSGEAVPKLKPGQRVWIDGPYGTFSMDREEGAGYLFIAGGVGITPIVSMLETMASRGDSRPVVLFYGAKTAADLTLRATLEALTPRLDLKVVYVLEHPAADWAGEHGFINTELLRRHLPKNLVHFQCFVCGPPVLMDLMEVDLPSLGVPVDRVHAERFDMV
jgi:predicted ferric reductase